jgi:hypothetical protein
VRQRVCKIVKSRPCIVIAALSTCAVVLVVTLLLTLPPREEDTGTSTLERLPEDGIISPQFSYEGNCTLHHTHARTRTHTLQKMPGAVMYETDD